MICAIDAHKPTQDFSNLSGDFRNPELGKSWRKQMKENNHMKTITNIIYLAFAVGILATGALTADATPGDLIAADYNGNAIQLPITPTIRLQSQ